MKLLFLTLFLVLNFTCVFQSGAKAATNQNYVNLNNTALAKNIKNNNTPQPADRGKPENPTPAGHR